MAGVVDTTYSFADNDLITSTKLNNIIDQTTFTSDALVFGNNTLQVSGGKLMVRASGITSNELASDSVITSKILDGSVTQAKASNMLVPAGAVMAFAMNAAPTGWLAADGSAVSRTTYATLFAAVSTIYGVGDGSTTFNLPDLRGYFVRGSGTNGDGTAAGTFGAKQADELKSHTHSTSPIASAGSQVPAGSGFGIIGSGVTGATGGAETRPKNIAMLYCIKH
jgi:microcystin-dependent protein